MIRLASLDRLVVLMVAENEGSVKVTAPQREDFLPMVLPLILESWDKMVARLVEYTSQDI